MKQPNGQPAPALAPRARFEYRCALLERDADLSQFGAEGWEAYGVIPQAADQAMFYFRRRA